MKTLTAAAAVGLIALAAQPAVAAEALRPALTSAFSPVAAFPGGVLTTGYLTPAYGEVAVKVSSSSGQLSLHSLGGDLASVGPTGVLSGYDERPSVLATSPTKSWNFGASVGYAGFYLHGGVNQAALVGWLLGSEGMQAGFGYEIGAFDMRMSYITSQGVGPGGASPERQIDGKQWAVGGMYNITPRVRLNADAFYAVSVTMGTAPAVSPVTVTPGAGARVGVELRF